MTHLKWIIPLLILTLVIAPVPVIQADELEASVEVLEGDVEVMQLGSKAWSTLRTDALVSSGDRVRTGEDGIALITWFEDGTFMELQPNSEMVIEEFSGDDETFIMDASLIRGSLFNSVRRLLDTNARYQINTPSQTATVRGTVFAVNVNDDMDTAVIVLEGTVHSEHPADTELFIPVENGNMIVVTKDDGITTDSETLSLEDAPDDYADLIEALTAFQDKLNDDFGEVETDANTEEDADDDSDGDSDEGSNDGDQASNANPDNNGVGGGVGGGQEDNRGVGEGGNNSGGGNGNGNSGGGGGNGNGNGN